MNNTDTTQLERARSVVEAREQGVAGELRELAALRQGAEQTLERLTQYLDEYNGVDHAPGARTQSPLELVNDRAFVKRLGTAITQQRAQAERLAERAAQKMAQWKRARADLAAIDRVIDNRERSARLVAARREQRETDASAARTHNPFATSADPEPRSQAPSTFRVEPRT